MLNNQAQGAAYFVSQADMQDYLKKRQVQIMSSLQEISYDMTEIVYAVGCQYVMESLIQAFGLDGVVQQLVAHCRSQHILIPLKLAFEKELKAGKNG